MLNKKEATDKGHAMAQELGKGWTTTLWENMGWHYTALSHGLTVEVFHPYNGGYLALIHEPGEVGGQSGLTGHGDTPRKAVENTVRLTRAEIGKLERWLEGVELR